MATSIPVARVSAVQGKAFAKGENGEMRQLQVGDLVYQGDVLVTAAGAHVDLTASDGRTLAIQANESVTVDAEVAGAVNPDATDSALLAAGKDADTILKAVNQGGSLDALLEETAAGDSTGGADGGSSFVRLLRIAESVDPLSFEFDAATDGVPDTLLGGSEANLPPVATDDIIAVVEDTPVSGNVLRNDADPEGGILSVTDYAVAGQAEVITAGNPAIIAGVGTLIIEVNGDFSFTPAPNYNGPVPAVTYTVSDAHGGKDTAILTLGPIVAVDDPSVMAPEAQTIAEDTAANGNVLSNDSDVDNPLSVEVFTINGVTYAADQSATIENVGTLTISANGDYTFTPEADWNGELPRVTYTLNTGSTSSLDITVTPVNDAPVTMDQSVVTPEDTPISGQIVATDVDVDAQGKHDTFTYSVTTPPGHGSVSIDANGNYTYTPAKDYNGPDSFVVTIEDGHGGTTTSKVALDVTPLNDAPVTADQRKVTPEDTPVSGQIVATDVNVDAQGKHDTMTYSVTTAPGHGSVSIDANGYFTYAPSRDYNGPDSFVVTVDDGHGGTTTSTVRIEVTPVNDVADVTTGGGSVTEDSVVFATGQLSVSDSDNGQSSFQVQSGTPGIYGTFAIGADGIWTYSLNNGAANVQALNGADHKTETFSVLSADGTLTTVTISVNGADEAVTMVPTIGGIEPGAAGTGDDNVSEGTNLIYNVSVTGTSATPTTFAFSLGGGTATASDDYGMPTFGPGVTDNGDGTITIDPGVTSFTVTVPTKTDTISGETVETVPLSIGGVTGTGGIIDVTGTPTIGGIEPGAAGTGDDNVSEGTNLIYNVSVTGTSATPTTFAFSLGGGTATASDDYGTPTFGPGVTDNGDGTITIDPGVTSFTVTVPTKTDTISGETVETVPLSIGGVTGTGGIIDVTGTPTIGGIEPGAAGTGDDNVSEGTNLIYNVSVTGTSATPTTFAFSLGGGTATASDDYGMPTFGPGVTDNGDGTITIDPGVTSFTVTVPTKTDTISGETVETVPLSIGGVTGTGGIIDVTGTPTIGGIEPGAAGTGDDNVSEGTNLIYNVSVTGTSATPTTFAFSLGGGTATASDDYGTPTFGPGVTDNGDGTITIDPGVTSFTVTVPTKTDTISGETVETVPLSIGGVTGTGGIIDVTGTPTIGGIEPGAAGTGDDNVSEGTNLIYNVSVTGTSATPTTFAFSLGGGTATASDDYGMPTFGPGVTDNGDGTITIDPGVTSFTVTVPTKTDTISGETVETVPLSIGGVTGTGGIIDVPKAPPILDLDTDDSHNIVSVQPITGLFNTGVDANGLRLAAGVVDLHYAVIAQPGGGAVTSMATSHSAWVANDADSSWIGNGTGNLPTGLYQYQTSFSLQAGADPTSVHIEMDVASDNYLRDVLVNGVSTGISSALSYRGLTHIALDGGSAAFQAGANTITFVVENRDPKYPVVSGPTGLRVDGLTGSVAVIGSDMVGHQPDYAAIYVEGTPVAIADSDVRILDVDNTTLQGATISLTNAQVGDVLIATSISGITATLNAAQTVVTLNGSASLADYETAIRSIQFSNTSESPSTTVDRAITVVVNDGVASSNVGLVTVHVVSVADAPSLDLDMSTAGRNYTVDYAKSGAAVSITNSASIADMDSMSVQSATIHLTDAQAGDVLAVSGLSSLFKVSEYDPVNGIITISATSSSALLADFQTALHAITFSSTSGTMTPRHIEVTVNDGLVNSNVATATINVYDRLGGDANDTIIGGASSDYIGGGKGDDTIDGGAGSDYIEGGKGHDVMTGGGLGSDVFAWKLADHGVMGTPDHDTITDFSPESKAAGGDVLDLRDLLQGEHQSGIDANLINYLHFEKSGLNTVVHVSSAGNFASDSHNVVDPVVSGHEDLTIILQNVDLTTAGATDQAIIQDLLTKGKLVTD